MHVKYPPFDLGFNKSHYPIYLKVARMVISNFPLLNSLFECFKGYESLNYNYAKNIVFSICIRDIKYNLKCILESEKLSLDDIDGNYVKNYINSSSNNLLRHLEKALSNIGYSNWECSEREEFKKRLTNETFYANNTNHEKNLSTNKNDQVTQEKRWHVYSNSYALFFELITFSHIGSNIGFKNIKFEPKLQSDKKGSKSSDIKICLNNREIYIELSIINYPLPTKKKEKIFYCIAKYLYEKIPDHNSRFKIYVNAMDLPTDHENHIDVSKSKELFCKQIDNLYLNELSGINICLDLYGYHIDSEIEKYLTWTLADYIQLDDPNYKLIKNNYVINNWAKKN